jgi:hypothetical protein
MPFPAINYCLVCESARPELGGKVSLLGFAGVTPNVDLGVQKFGLPMLLTLVFGFSPMEDVSQLYNHEIHIINPDGSFLARTPASPVNAERGKPGLLVLSIPVLAMEPGRRTVRVIVNREQRFEDSFMIRLASHQELAHFGVRMQ